MQHVLCDECLRTYKPYTYRETLKRALVSGVDEWQDEDDEHHINNRYMEYLTERPYNFHELRYLNPSRNISFRDKICNLFSSVDDFNVCHERFNKERLTKISASFLCFDCERYLCAKCITQHSEHFTFSEDDKNNTEKWDKIEIKIIQTFNIEGDRKEEYIKQERAVLCNVVDVRDSVSVTEWEELISSVETNIYRLGSELDRYYFERGVCILNDNQTLLVLNDMSIKVYNFSSYERIGSIELLYSPAGISEIPSTDPSQSLIAVGFPYERKIKIMNITIRPADVISSLNVQGEFYDLAYCNNKLITRCLDNLGEEYRHSIHVMNMTGEIINIIDLKDLWLYDCSSMCVHSISETIYVCDGVFRVTCLSFTGQVLHTTRFTDTVPHNICVDRDQNVYVMGLSLPLYKLSSDLSERVKIIDKDAAYVGVTSIKHHKKKMYMVGAEGFVYIFSVD